MKEQRDIIAAAISLVALTGAILLAALNRDAVFITALLGASSSFGMYAIGLQSDPRTGDTNE